MIKIKLFFKKNEKLIQEEKRFIVPATALQEIQKIFEQCYKSRRDTKAIVKVPLKEITKFDIENRKRGLPFYYYANVLGNDFTNIKDLKKYWNAEKKMFDEAYLTKISNETLDLEVTCTFKDKTTNKGRFSTKQHGQIKTEYFVQFYLQNIPQKEMNFTIEHELHHLPQFADVTILKYGEMIYKVNDVKKMSPIPISKDGNRTHEPTGIGQKINKTISLKTEPEKYAAEDVEYIPNFALRMREMFINLRKVSDIDKFMDNPKIEASKIAGKYSNLLLNDETFRNNLAGDNDLLYNYINVNRQIRPREFPKDLIKTITDKINNYRKVKFGT